MSYLSLIIAALALLSTSHARTFSFQNNCQFTVWVGALSNDGKEAPSNGGWQLDAGKGNSVDTADDWRGRFWGRTDCNFDGSGKGQCATGDCGGVLECKGAGGVPPVSLAEFTLKGDHDQDFFDISLVDGFNLPMSIKPDNAEGPVCNVDINQKCPDELAVKSQDGSKVIACMSDCEKQNTDEVCCRGEFNDPNKCKPPPHANTFEDPCPQAYSWAYDDKTSTFTAKGGNYQIIFCPSASEGFLSLTKWSFYY